tara:strand:- start:7076 stop:7936 length:861 start_codon:yes stop_codon:yes gene_type:complete
MIKSMTGFGRGSAKIKGGQINVEIQSLNSRYIDLKFLGFSLSPDSEDRFRRIISKNLNRGSIKVYIEIDNIKDTQAITLNQARFEKTVKILDDIDKRYGQRLKLSEVINLNDILSFVDSNFNEEDKLIDAIENALVQLNKMRSSEGKQLYKDLTKRINIIGKSLTLIKKLSDKIPKIKLKELREKISSLIDQDSIDKNRLMQEVAYLVERADITEEIVRANIHLDNFIQYLKYDEPVGKRLNFLIQEISREINTIGSKSPIHNITTKIVEIKNEIEKIREQIQNIL